MFTLAFSLDNLCIDLPPDIGKDLKKYNATLGHKTNHNFEPNIEYKIFSVHPVLGTVMSLVALKTILAGAEFTGNYAYDTSIPQPAWFLEEWRKFSTEKEAEIKKKLPWIGKL